MRDWYITNNKDYEAFAEKYPFPDNKIIEDQIKAMSNWCDKANITFTPTIFINGYLMPANYTAEELKNIY